MLFICGFWFLMLMLPFILLLDNYMLIRYRYLTSLIISQSYLCILIGFKCSKYFKFSLVYSTEYIKCS